MSQSITMFLLVHGFGFCYLVLIGLYLFFSKRSAFIVNETPNLTIRKATGFAAIVWGLTYLPRLHYPFTRDIAEAQYYNNLSMMAALLICPAVAYMLQTYLQMKTRRTLFILPNLLVSAALIIVYYVTEDNTWVKTNIILWGIYAVNFSSYYIRMAMDYQKNIKLQYADVEHKHLSWLQYLLFFLFAYLILFVFSSYYNLPIFIYLHIVLALSFWTYLFLQVDVQEKVEGIWELADDKKRSHASGHTTDTENLDPEDKLEWIGQQLEKECEYTQLYCNSDLTLDALSRVIGTNRTYLSKYFAQKGMTYYSYINKLRVEYAARKIEEAESDINLEAIVADCGFKNANTFRRAFKEIMGHLPSEHKKS